MEVCGGLGALLVVENYIEQQKRPVFAARYVDRKHRDRLLLALNDQASAEAGTR